MIFDIFPVIAALYRCEKPYQSKKLVKWAGHNCSSHWPRQKDTLKCQFLFKMKGRSFERPFKGGGNEKGFFSTIYYLMIWDSVPENNNFF